MSDKFEQNPTYDNGGALQYWTNRFEMRDRRGAALESLSIGNHALWFSVIQGDSHYAVYAVDDKEATRKVVEQSAEEFPFTPLTLRPYTLRREQSELSANYLDLGTDILRIIPGSIERYPLERQTILTPKQLSALEAAGIDTSPYSTLE